MKKLKLTLVIFLFGLRLTGQTVPNDNCDDAEVIQIDKGGKATGIFKSKITDITNASREIGEVCSKGLEDFGNCDKTVWYRFYVNGTRNISITLTQSDTSIPQIFSGFTVYEIKDCNYTLSDISGQLPALNQFGKSGNVCLRTGWYLVQIAARDKANGLIQMVLKSNYPNQNPADNYQTVSQLWVNTYFSEVNPGFDCTANDSIEEQGGADSFKHCIWYKIVTEASYSYIIKATQAYNGYFAYRLFLDSISPSIIARSGPIALSSNQKIYGSPCNGRQPSIIYLQVFSQYEYSGLRIGFAKYKEMADDWNTPDTRDSIIIENNMRTSGRHYFNCSSLLSTHRCKNAIPSIITKKYPNSNVIDTFPYGAYTIIKAKKSGIFEVYISRLNYYLKVLAFVYKGDIRYGCQLKPYTDPQYPYNMRFCVDSGQTYTLLIASTELYSEELLCSYNFSSQYYRINYHQPQIAEQMGTYYDNIGELSSNTVDYTEYKQSIKIDTFKLTGHLSYHEVFIDQPSAILFDVYRCGLNIFSGQVSKGAATLIDGFRYRNAYYSGNGQLGPNEYAGDPCYIFKPGYYTIICSNLYDTTNLRCTERDHWFKIRKMTFCPTPNNNNPEFALPVNGGRDLLSEPGAKNNQSYYYTLSYCSDCKTFSTFKPLISCAFEKADYLKDYNIFYYTFFIKEDCSFNMVNYTYFDVFEGDASKNKTFLLNQNLLLDKCESRQSICNLRGNRTYTIVIYVYKYSTGNFTVQITPHIKTENDNISSAEDLGYFNTTRSMTSKLQTITCHTNSSKYDPYNSDRPPLPYITQYKDTPNLYRNATLKTIFYTLSVAGNTSVTLRYNQYARNVISANLLRCKWPFEIDYKKALSLNPDTLITGFEALGRTGGWDNIVIVNKSCKPERYVVMFTMYSSMDLYVSNQFQMEIFSTSTGFDLTGDHCSNAVTKNITGTGSYQMTLTNSCHTYGSSAFESDAAPGIKSSWFKVNVRQTGKIDLGFQMLNGAGVRGYNVFAGYCGAMSRLTEQSNRYAYFSLSCMNEGTYFIQVLCDETVNSSISFQVEVTQTPNAKCNSYDFKVPLANYKFIGGCQYNDTLKFINNSTQGEDIEYSWIINGQKVSTARNIILNRRDPGLKDSNEFMLIVRNKVLKYADTQVMVYRKDTTIYQFDIYGLSRVHCYDRNVLRLKTNYPHRLNHEWKDALYDYALGYNDTLALGGAEGSYVLNSQSDNCQFSDTFKISRISTIHKYRDTILCESGSWTINNNSNNYMAINGEYVMPQGSYSIRKAGRYIISFADSFCFYNDTFNVQIETGPNKVSVVDNLYNCNTDTMFLTNKTHKFTLPVWHDGDTARSRIVNKSGSYTLRGRISYCKTLVHEFRVTLEKVNTKILRDTLLCRYDPYDIDNPFGPLFKVSYASPPIGQIVTDKAFDRILEVSRGYCKIRDTAFVSVRNNRSSRKDTSHCEDNAVFNFIIDGGMAASHHWILSGNRTRNEKVTDYGIYPVARTDANNCRDTLSVHLNNVCEFNVYIPDVFSPNENGNNDVFRPVIPSLYQNLSINIYNRWGELVYSSDQNKGWDGTYMGSAAQQGVYSYLIRVADQYGKMYLYRGTITLLR